MTHIVVYKGVIQTTQNRIRFVSPQYQRQKKFFFRFFKAWPRAWHIELEQRCLDSYRQQQISQPDCETSSKVPGLTYREPCTPHQSHLTLSLLLHNASWETGLQCNLCNGGFQVICISDSLSQNVANIRWESLQECFLTVRESIRMLFFLYQVNFHDTESALFHIRMENGVALWLLYNFLLSFCLPICRHRVFSMVFYKA